MKERLTIETKNNRLAVIECNMSAENYINSIQLLVRYLFQKIKMSVEETNANEEDMAERYNDICESLKMLIEAERHLAGMV